MGIEPTTTAWKAVVLPLNYTRMQIGKTGFEPATPWSQTMCSTKLSYFPHFPGLKTIKPTYNKKRPVFYKVFNCPVSSGAFYAAVNRSFLHEKIARPRGVEPLTF
jgi:hypothetical protein